jgi:hypothetical protein
VKRSLLLRTAAFWAALLLVLTWGTDAAGLHACPHHGVVAMVQSGQMAHGHGAHLGHGTHAPSPDHQDCTCIGCCHAGTVALAPDAASLAIRTAESNQPAAPVRRDESALPPPPPYLLPYSTAPPFVA